MSDSEGSSSSSSVSAVFSSQAESSDPEPARPPPNKVAKVSKKVVEKGKKKNQPRRLSSPHLEASKQPAKKRRIIAVDEDPLDIKNETLITLVEANPSIWDQSDSSHNDIIKNRKLWEKIICQLDPRYLDKSASSKKKIANAVYTRWRSIRDRFVRDFRSSQNTPSGRKRSSAKDEVNAIIVDGLQRLEDLCRSDHRDLRREITELQSRESVYAANEWKLLLLSYVPVAQKIPPHRNVMFRQRLNDLVKEFLGPQEPTSLRPRTMDMPSYKPQYRGQGEPSMEKAM
ncbi:uncharacterized protein LOC143766056 [Ranitomeya variabilis]|uniref:uncharacterized protein LOC143766056 n=1 Tax=Ranitomeya variabilis TaxID=490064 RepID=UPI004056EA96